MGIIDAARRAKHQGTIRWKHAKWAARDLRIKVDDWRWAARSRRGGFTFYPEQFAATFLTRLPTEELVIGPAPAVCWAFWFGAEPNARRAAAIKALEKQPDIELRIITDPSEIELPDHPFHPAFHDLDAIHRSDYLRAYVMHHHGGAYADIKQFNSEIRPVIDQVNESPTAWVAGYREITSEYVPDLPRELGWYLKHEYRRVVGPSGFVCKPRTPFTSEWMRELHARLDYYAEPLREADWRDGSSYDRPLHYPIRWSEIAGDIMQPLCLKYQEHILFTDAIRPVLKDYR